MNMLTILIFPAFSLIAISFGTATRHCHNGTGRCYWLGTGSKTWNAARTACQSEGGDLAVMETEELWNFVADTLGYDT